MALEAWAHIRIEGGEDLDAVLKDVLGAPEAPAAYLLVAIDLLLSHWPKTQEAAVPFLASPRLLSVDRERQVHDHTQLPDILGLSAIQKEPVGAATLADLQKRPSRRRLLENLLGNYAFYTPSELRDRLTSLLREEAADLEAPDAQAIMADPALMVQHALNLIDPANWQDVTVRLADGNTADAKQYVAPEAEARHFDALQAKNADYFADANLEARLSLAINDPSKSTPDMAMAAVEWAHRQPVRADQNKTGDRMRSHSIVSAAMIAMRDGDAALRSEHRTWADGVFASVLQEREDSAHRMRSGLRFNPPAIAFAGMVHALKDGVRPGDMRELLKMAARSNPAAAHGFGAVVGQLAAIDERMPRALLRCALVAAIRLRRRWDTTEEDTARGAETYRRQCEAAVAAELAWLSGEAPEPAWPTWPLDHPQPRRRLRLYGGDDDNVAAALPARHDDEYTDHQAAALWLSNCRGLFDPEAPPRILDMVRAYSEWTANVNGAGLAINDDFTGKPRDWNDAYLDALANCLPVLTPPEVDKLALDPIRSLPEESFLDALATFIRHVDGVFFNDRRLSPETAVHIRSALAERLKETSRWQNMARHPSTSIEMHLGPAAAAVFFNSHGFGQPAAAYLYSKGIDRLGPFLPLLERLASEAPCLFVAIVTLNLLEVAPRIEHATLLVGAAKALVVGFPDHTDFWINRGIGRRVSALVDTILIRSNALFGVHSPLRPDVHAVLAAMVRVGVPEATRSEREIEAATSGRQPG